MSFKLCVIGCGNIATRCHGPSYKKYQAENPGFVLAGCCDINSESAKTFADKFGFKHYYTNYTEMLTKEKPDAVCILVTEEHIANIGINVMKLGFPIFIEKPPGKNITETNALVKAAKESGVIHQVSYNRRGIPILHKLKDWMHEAVAKNEIQYIRYDMYRVGRFDKDFSDTAIHGIDAVRYIADADYKSVQFSYQMLPQYGENVKNIYMNCVMTSGVHAQLCFCPVSGVVLERAVVNAKDNTWMANIPIWEYGYDIPGELLHICNNETSAKISGADLCESNDVYITNGFYNENKNFFDNVKNKQMCSNGFEKSLNAIHIKDCVSQGNTTFTSSA